MQLAGKFLSRWRTPVAAIGISTFLALAGGWSSAVSSPAPLCLSGPDQPRFVGAEELSSEFDILSWNIQKASNEGWADDLANFGAGISLAFIQEASLQAPIEATLPAPLYQAFAAGYTTATLDTGVMTLSAGSPTRECRFTAMEPWLGTPKATSITEHPLADREENLLAINLHAVNFALGINDFQRQIHALGEVLTNHRGPVILAGDLNTWSERRQLLVDEFARRHDLLPVQFQPDLRSTVFGRALDHIYIRGLEADSARAIPVSSSDHNPLRVRLRLR